MAEVFDKSNIKSKISWSNSLDRDRAFPLDINQYFGSYESAAAAAAEACDAGSTKSKYYYGMQVYVFDGSSISTYVISSDNTLIDISGAPTLFTTDESTMLAITNIVAGQQVVRNDTKSIWVFAGGDTTSIDNWTEICQVWQETTDKVNMYALTQAAYDALSEVSSNTVYFITDSKKIFKGSDDMTMSIIVTDEIPDASEAVTNKLYIDSNTFECKVTTDNESWLVASPGYLTDSANWATADSSRMATIGLIKAAITATVDKINEEIANQLANKVDKVYGTEDNIVVFDEDGAIKDSGVTTDDVTLHWSAM